MQVAIKNKRDTSAGEFFDVEITGFGTVYGCKYKAGTSKKGEPYEFIATPQRKGSNDSWFDIVKLYPEVAKAALAAYKGEGGGGSAVTDPLAEIPFNPDDDLPFLLPPHYRV